HIQLHSFPTRRSSDLNHVRKIVMKDGIDYIIPKIKGNCQLIWSSNIVEYFESLKPSVYFHMLDCGTNQTFDFAQVDNKINTFHQDRKSTRLNSSHVKI